MDIEEDDFVERFYTFVPYNPNEVYSDTDNPSGSQSQNDMSGRKRSAPILNKTKKGVTPPSPPSSSPPLRRIHIDCKSGSSGRKSVTKNLSKQFVEDPTPRFYDLTLPTTSKSRKSPKQRIGETTRLEFFDLGLGSQSSNYSSSVLTDMSLGNNSSTNLNYTDPSLSDHSSPSKKFRHSFSGDTTDARRDLSKKKSRYSWHREHSSSGSSSELNRSCKPMYLDHQLIGDSQFVRYTQSIMPYKYNISFTDGCRHIGYCVSGQKIGDLWRRLQTKSFDIHKNVILLIGTNDIRFGTKFKDMTDNYTSVLEFLKKETRKLVLLTVPPLPKLESSLRHWEILQKFNNFITKQADDEKVFVVDTASLFITYNNKTSQSYFEQVYLSNNKEDKIHLNSDGFQLIKAILDICYFKKMMR